MKSERSSRLVLFSLISAITILHAIKIREQQYTSTQTGSERFLAKLPGVSSILTARDASLSR